MYGTDLDQERRQTPPEAAAPSRRVEKLLLVYYVYGGVGYFLVGHDVVSAGNAATLRTRLDDWLSFSNGFVWVYVLDYLLPVLMVLLLRRVRPAQNLVLSFAVVFTLSFLIFTLYPVRMVRPGETGVGLAGLLLGWIYALDDPPVNAFPSLHVAVSALTGLIVWHHCRGRSSCSLA